ncbi:ATP-binding cassette domain-containing protein [Rathayibacter tanaceti]|uniref:ATP-binding cassette domain-containing protein n=1 Tax=Rathayibacter tanaceti TaxID=1671680 RepID=A0AAE6RM90_9MICO|nr:ATP-binding cassette domain-containing protein [Rathayibacter tanaceti]
MQGIDFQYGTSRIVHSRWSGRFHAGEITALTGPSGSGKSTLLYIAGLLLSPTSGHVLVDGLQLDSLSDRRKAWSRAHRYGFVFQDAALDSSRTVLDNIIESALYRGDNQRDSISRALFLIEWLGVDVDPLRRPGEISGGQAQRISLCRALLGSPDIVVADEPTGNLDVESSKKVMGALRFAADQGAAVVVATHDLQFAAASDKVYRL